MFLVAFFLTLRERSGPRQTPAEWSPCIYTYTPEYIRSFFFSGVRSGVFFRLGLSMRFAELEFPVK